MEEKRKAYRLLVAKRKGERPLGRPRRRWVNNIKMDLGEIEWRGDWITLAQDRDKWRALVNAVMNHKMVGGSRVASQLVSPQFGCNRDLNVIINVRLCLDQDIYCKVNLSLY
jgi:hypothetical protein